MPYERKTIDIFISDELKNILQEIESESLVAHLLLKKRHNKEDIVEDNVNYISVSASDKRRISYMSHDRIDSIDESEFWVSSRRYNVKPGSFISKVFKNIPAKEVEKFSNLFRAEVVKPNFRFEVITGERIKELYKYDSYASDRGSLGISCMKHEHCQKFFNIYSDNTDNISLLAMFDNDNLLIGRALLWNFDSFKIMDRIYTKCDEEYSLYFKKWAVKNDYLHKSEQNWYNTIFFEQFGQKQIELKLEVKLPYGQQELYPYMDTFKFISDDGNLYNYQPEGIRYKTLCSCDGQKQSSDYLRFDSISKVFRYPGDTVWLEYLSIYTHHDSCYYSESNDRHILRKDTIYDEEIRDYIFNEENDSFNNKKRIEERRSYYKEREQSRSKKMKLKSVEYDMGSPFDNISLDNAGVDISRFYNYITTRMSNRGESTRIEDTREEVSREEVNEAPALRASTSRIEDTREEVSREEVNEEVDTTNENTVRFGVPSPASTSDRYNNYSGYVSEMMYNHPLPRGWRQHPVEESEGSITNRTESDTPIESDNTESGISRDQIEQYLFDI